MYLINFWANSVKFSGSYSPINFWAIFKKKILQSYGPILGASICWGHSVLQTLALVYIIMTLYWCFMALQQFSGHFGRGPHSSWASILGSLPVHVLIAHSFASN